MTRSLRARLLAATVLAALVALAIVDAATYTLVTRAQLEQVDQDLERSHPPIERAAASPGGHAAQAIQAVAPASYVEVRDASGSPTVVVPLRRPGAPAIELDDLRLEPRGAGPGDDEATFASVHSADGGEAVRVRVSRQEDGGVLIIGQTMRQVEQTRDRLLWVLGAGTLGALVAVGLVGAWFVRLGLAPLREVELAAAEVTGSDLDRRVPGGSSDTEVGRLAAAINTMLDRLHDAFLQRERDVEALRASEARMRRFVADASHELRTPLAATAAYAELFERGARDRPEDLARAMAGIRSETARMAELVEDLLLLAQLDEGRPLEQVDVDLADVAASAAQAAHAVDPDRHVALVVDDVVVVRGDPGRLRQVFDNLLANVRAHTPAGTACAIEITRDGSDAVVVVSDDGPGLASEELLRATDRFYRADASRARTSGGAGLGLAIVAAIVEAHHGSTAASAGDGGGLRITIRIPATSPRVDSPPAPSGAPRG
jgi:two-component system OmpR family sensor kinase